MNHCGPSVHHSFNHTFTSRPQVRLSDCLSDSAVSRPHYSVFIIFIATAAKTTAGVLQSGDNVESYYGVTEYLWVGPGKPLGYIRNAKCGTFRTPSCPS